MCICAIALFGRIVRASPLTFVHDSLRITVDYSFSVKEGIKNKKSALTGNSTDGKFYRERMYMDSMYAATSLYGTFGTGP